MILIKILMIVLLACAAYQDLKTQLVSDFFMLPFCILGAFTAVLRGDFLSSIFAAILVITVLFTKENRKIGGADLLIIAGFTAFFGFAKALEILISLCLLSLVIYGIERIFKINYATKDGGIALLVPSFLVFIFYLIWG